MKPDYLTYEEWEKVKDLPQPPDGAKWNKKWIELGQSADIIFSTSVPHPEKMVAYRIKK